MLYSKKNTIYTIMISVLPLILIITTTNTYAMFNLRGASTETIDVIDGVKYIHELGIVCYGRSEGRHYIWINTEKKEGDYSSIELPTNMESRDKTCEIIALGNNCLAALLENGKIIILTRPDSKTEDWHSDTLLEHRLGFSIAALSNRQFVTISYDCSICIWTLKDNRWHQEKIERILGKEYL